MTFQMLHCYLQHRDRVEPPSIWRGRRYWVLSRALCAFRVFRAPAAARSNLRSFAGIKAREWAPFADAGFLAHLTGDTVAIWTWDAVRVRDAMLGVEVMPGRMTVLPETALQVRGADGLRIVRCVEGFEGQCWSDGELRASRWWAEMPSAQSWTEFQRTSRATPEQFRDLPAAQEPVWRRRPWTNSGEGLGSTIERRHRELVTAGAVVLVVAYGYLGGGVARDAVALSDLENRVRSLEAEKAPVVDDRVRAIQNREFLAGFQKLIPYPPQFELFARVAAHLPKESRITGWSYEDGSLQFTIAASTQPDLLFYVKNYAAVTGFTDVTADRAEGERTLRVKLRILP